MTMKTFNLKVEGNFDSDNPLVIPPSILELNSLEWGADSPPDVIVLDGGTMLVKGGRYAMPGDNYSYRVATMARLIDGQLQSGSGGK